MGLFQDVANASAGKFPGGSPPAVNPYERNLFGQPGQNQQQQQEDVTIERLKQIVGSRWDTEYLKSILPQLQALGIEVQNQQRGDLRPRFRLPNGDVWDFGPGGWQSRGRMGPGFTDEGGPGPGQGPAFQTSEQQDPSQLFSNTPGYQFTMGEALNAIQRSAAARGTLLTGGTLKALQNRAGDVANRYYQDYINNLRGLI